jgi:hypothetical protein
VPAGVVVKRIRCQAPLCDWLSGPFEATDWDDVPSFVHMAVLRHIGDEHPSLFEWAVDNAFGGAA